MHSFGLNDDIYCHLSASLCAGFLAVTAGSPFDVIKSRCMGEHVGSMQNRQGGEATVNALRCLF